MHDSRRRHPRIDLSVVVNCDKTYTAQSKDISEGGMCLVADERMESGRMLDLRFYLPNSSNELHAFGKVQWCRSSAHGGFEVGVSFWNIAEEDKKSLIAFLAYGSRERKGA
jgi:c-di-GMP-binding flagellar brake protein YcgR